MVILLSTFSLPIPLLTSIQLVLTAKTTTLQVLLPAPFLSLPPPLPSHQLQLCYTWHIVPVYVSIVLALATFVYMRKINEHCRVKTWFVTKQCCKSTWKVIKIMSPTVAPKYIMETHIKYAHILLCNYIQQTNYLKSLTPQSKPDFNSCTCQLW